MGDRGPITRICICIPPLKFFPSPVNAALPRRSCCAALASGITLYYSCARGTRVGLLRLLTQRHSWLLASHHRMVPLARISFFSGSGSALTGLASWAKLRQKNLMQREQYRRPSSIRLPRADFSSLQKWHSKLNWCTI